MLIKKWSSSNNLPCIFDEYQSVNYEGYQLNVQTSPDGGCYICCDDLSDNFLNTTELKIKTRLIDILTVPAKIFIINLQYRCNWKHILATIEAVEVLDKAIFCSTNHSTILQLWSACHEARCGFIWGTDEADDIDCETLINLPNELVLCISLDSILSRPQFWRTYQNRLYINQMYDYSLLKKNKIEPYIYCCN